MVGTNGPKPEATIREWDEASMLKFIMCKENLRQQSGIKQS